MKNIHLIPTDKPSNITIQKRTGKLLYDTEPFTHDEYDVISNQNIYITSDKEIKEECYWLYICHINGLDYGYNGNPIVKNNLPNSWFQKLHDKKNYKKIILTTDQDLIKDGVQAIDDEFLEWFVDNPSCEEVEVADLWKDGTPSAHYNYQIIIPKEEPKQDWYCPKCQSYVSSESVTF